MDRTRFIYVLLYTTTYTTLKSRLRNAACSFLSCAPRHVLSVICSLSCSLGLYVLCHVFSVTCSLSCTLCHVRSVMFSLSCFLCHVFSVVCSLSCALGHVRSAMRFLSRGCPSCALCHVLFHHRLNASRTKKIIKDGYSKHKLFLSMPSFVKLNFGNISPYLPALHCLGDGITRPAPDMRAVELWEVE